MTSIPPRAPRWSLESYEPASHGTGHLDVIGAVYHEYGFKWDPTHPYFADLVDPIAYYSRKGGFFSVAVRQGRVVGTVGGTPSDGEWELHRLYVHPEFRRQGLGSTLVEEFLGRARRARAARAVLWSDKKLVDAHRLYERFGFSVIGERVCDDPDSSVEWAMALDLRR